MKMISLMTVLASLLLQADIRPEKSWVPSKGMPLKISELEISAQKFLAVKLKWGQPVVFESYNLVRRRGFWIYELEYRPVPPGAATSGPIKFDKVFVDFDGVCYDDVTFGLLLAKIRGEKEKPEPREASERDRPERDRPD